MLRATHVPIVQQDLAPAETYAQLADSLEALVAASDAVVDRFAAHVARETGEQFPCAPPPDWSSSKTGTQSHIAHLMPGLRCHREALGTAASRGGSALRAGGLTRPCASHHARPTARAARTAGRGLAAPLPASARRRRLAAAEPRRRGQASGGRRQSQQCARIRFATP